MSATDALLARLQAEVEERSSFMDGIVEDAEKASRDLTAEEMGLLARTRERIQAVQDQIDPLAEAAKIAHTSRQRTAEIAEQFRAARDPDAIRSYEYRSAGQYILDVWRAGLGHEEPAQRLDLFKRAAAHQTTADNPGLLPEQVLGPVLSFVDEGRPVINALGPRQLPSGAWSRPTVVQHTTVGVQTAEKTELVSQKMTINKVPVTAETVGGYLNLSRQDIDWTQPAIMDIVINDLAGQYAKETENMMADKLVSDGVAGPTIPTGTPTPEAIAAAFWTAAGAVYAATLGAGRVIAVAGPDMLAMLGPLFPPYNPSNAQSTGFQASGFATGPVGAIAGIPLYVTAGMAPNTIVVMSTAAAEVYEDRIGALQVAEPSVLGVQVAYAGYFARLILQPAGIVKIVKTP